MLAHSAPILSARELVRAQLTGGRIPAGMRCSSLGKGPRVMSVACAIAAQTVVPVARGVGE